MNRYGDSPLGPELILDSTEFFRQSVEEAFSSLKIKGLPQVKTYLTELLHHFMVTDNLYEVCEDSGKRKNVTLAELFLEANLLEHKMREEQLKRLGDMSLYMSGFFGDSLKRKIIDIDYYISIGGSAYGSLSTLVTQDVIAKIYEDIAENFVSYVDALTYISQRTQIQSNKDLLRLYDRYIATGSELAKEQLAEKGLLNAQSKKAIKN
ncbi:MAG: hypothetical protein CL677_10305 [Bdellovibrionaceae bacterium]|nr:hypothetical protein [Pseudobdellovibrionaceae bacterium]